MATRARLSTDQWVDHYWWSADEVRLHTRIYEPQEDAGLAPVLCLHGLTRNARDFELLAPHIARRRRVYAVEFRGRGDSGYARDALSYTPLIYMQDVAALLAERGIHQFLSIGTSLGGLVTMLLAATMPGRLAGAVLNDVGPEIDPRGLERIKTYVGQGSSFPTWVHAARAMEALHGDVYPGWQLEDWLVQAKRTHRLTREGRIVADYDANISQPFKVPGGEAGVDLWPAFDALNGTPTLILRGELSDILSPDVAARMVARAGNARLATVPGVGHAPTMDEPEAVAAIDAFLDGLTV